MVQFEGRKDIALLNACHFPYYEPLTILKIAPLSLPPVVLFFHAGFNVTNTIYDAVNDVIMVEVDAQCVKPTSS